MIPVTQTTFGDGSDGSPPGNCQSACLASLLHLSIDEVPNFAAAGVGYWDAMQEWLATLGLYIFELKAPPHATPGAPDDLHYIASGKSPRGLSHAVVMRDGELVHDPHPSRAGIVAAERFYILGRLV